MSKNRFYGANFQLLTREILRKLKSISLRKFGKKAYKIGFRVLKIWTMLLSQQTCFGLFQCHPKLVFRYCSILMTRLSSCYLLERDPFKWRYSYKFKIKRNLLALHERKNTEKLTNESYNNNTEKFSHAADHIQRKHFEKKLWGFKIMKVDVNISFTSPPSPSK